MFFQTFEKSRSRFEDSKAHGVGNHSDPLNQDLRTKCGEVEVV